MDHTEVLLSLRATLDQPPPNLLSYNTRMRPPYCGFVQVGFWSIAPFGTSCCSACPRSRSGQLYAGSYRSTIVGRLFLGAIRSSQILLEVLDVYFHSFFRNEDLFGDVTIPVSVGDVFLTPHTDLIQLAIFIAGRGLDGSPKTFQNKKIDRRSAAAEDFLRLVVDTIPALVVSARPDGSVDFINKGWRDYAGLPLENLTGWGWNSASLVPGADPYCRHCNITGVTQLGTIQWLNPNAFVSAVDPATGTCNGGNFAPICQF